MNKLGYTIGYLRGRKLAIRLQVSYTLLTIETVFLLYIGRFILPPSIVRTWAYSIGEAGKLLRARYEEIEARIAELKDLSLPR